jgi:hypothetical protein
METTGNRRTTAAGLPRALAVVQAHCFGAPALGKASTGAAGLGEPPGGAPERCGDDGVRKLGFHLLRPKSEAKQALYIGLFVRRSPM